MTIQVTDLLWKCIDRFYTAQLAGYEKRAAKLSKWYLTGDTMHQDADGYLYFVARNEDIIRCRG
jgi:acyl-coenzyme A synthetase/AMP-(fatty) acid ligase